MGIVEIDVEIPPKGFPLDIELMKFEMFPPGQAATKIIPKATVGVGFSNRTNKKVNAGNKNVWLMNPIINDLGLFRISRKCSALMSSATPNMIKARAIHF